jgi:hypothetical protein
LTRTTQTSPWPAATIANVLSSQGRYEGAQPLFERALAIYEKALDPNHPNVATACGNLANVVK